MHLPGILIPPGACISNRIISTPIHPYFKLELFLTPPISMRNICWASPITSSSCVPMHGNTMPPIRTRRIGWTECLCWVVSFGMQNFPQLSSVAAENSLPLHVFFRTNFQCLCVRVSLIPIPYGPRWQQQCGAYLPTWPRLCKPSRAGLWFY